MQLLALTASVFSLCVLIGIAALIALPATEQKVSVAPRYASVETGPVTLPLNLPEPAAGQTSLKIPLKVPVKKAEPPAAIPSSADDQGAGSAPISDAVSQKAETRSPVVRTPRRPLAKYTQIAGNLTLPTIASDGSTPLEYYKSAPLPAAADDKARIALIITGVGLNSTRSKALMDALPNTITIAISPYGQDPQRWVNAALDQDRDALMMVPMEPNSFPSVDPGPDTLMRDAPELQTLERLHRVLSKAQGYVGIMNDTGSRFTANAIALAPVLNDVSKRGIMVVDARASAYSVLASEAAKRDIPVAINTRFVDSSLTPEDIRRQLRDLERTAKTLGVAVGIARDLPVSIREVEQWQAALDTQEFVLAPISAVANQQPVR